MRLQDSDFWCVNLASRPDRRAHAEAEFAKVGIAANRLEAFTPDQWRGTQDQIARMKTGVKGGTPGAIGCYCSQTEIIRKAVDTGKTVGVFEDDVCFCSDFQKRLDYLNDHLTWDWDIVWLGGTFHVPGQWYRHEDCRSWAHLGCDVTLTDDPRILRTFGAWSTYAYFVNGKNARKVYDLFEKNIHRARGIDHLAIILGPELNAFCMVPGCCKQYDNRSDIGNGVTVLSAFSSLGKYWYADKMEDFNPNIMNWETGEYQP